MPLSQEIKIGLEGVSEALKARRFKVPPYQRSYAWETEHVSALLQDITEALKNKEKEYFLGSLVVTGPADQRYEVVDGQQRLTTISLVIAAIKDLLNEYGEDAEVVANLKNDFLVSKDRKTKEKEPKLILNEIDNELYQELIENISDVEQHRSKHHSEDRLLKAAHTALSYIKSLCTSSNNAQEILHSWLDYLEKNLKVIIVITPDDSNAFTIFETLNDRGLELAISDLIKNYLFDKSGDKLEEAKNRWTSMVAALKSASDSPIVVTYLRQFAMSRYGLVREKDLFRVIKEKITSKQVAVQFASALSDTAKNYSALLNTDHELWSNYDLKVRDCAKALDLLGMIQIRPLLLAILESFESLEIEKSFKKLEAVAVRFQIIGGGGGTLEKIYSETAKLVTEGTLKTASEIVQAFTTLPLDPDFERAFSSARISKQKLARYYLIKLEKFVDTNENEKIPNSDPSSVNLEHILPATLSEGWQTDWFSDNADAFYNRLGNLALMSAKNNSAIGNKSFVTKKDAYERSTFHFTKTLSKYTTWDKAAIESRQKEMATIAVKVWSVK